MANETTKIAIVGKAPASRNEIPSADESWEIWTLSDLVLAEQVPRFSRHFEIHPLKHFREKPHLAAYYRWMCSIHDKPLYLQELDPNIPAGVLYPLEQVTTKFGRYFTNTVSFMLALAIMEEPSQIGIYGVDMAQTPEYRAQRPSCEWLIGWAMGAGIKVYIPQTSDLLKTRVLYAFEGENGQMYDKWKARTKELNNRIQKKQEVADQTALELAFLQGAREAQEYYSQYIGEQWTSSS